MTMMGDDESATPAAAPEALAESKEEPGKTEEKKVQEADEKKPEEAAPVAPAEEKKEEPAKEEGKEGEKAPPAAPVLPKGDKLAYNKGTKVDLTNAGSKE
jgi:hypothetical protein